MRKRLRTETPMNWVTPNLATQRTNRLDMLHVMLAGYRTAAIPNTDFRRT